MMNLVMSNKHLYHIYHQKIFALKLPNISFTIFFIVMTHPDLANEPANMGRDMPGIKILT